MGVPYRPLTQTHPKHWGMVPQTNCALRLALKRKEIAFCSSRQVVHVVEYLHVVHSIPDHLAQTPPSNWGRSTEAKIVFGDWLVNGEKQRFGFNRQVCPLWWVFTRYHTWPPSSAPSPNVKFGSPSAKLSRRCAPDWKEWQYRQVTCTRVRVLGRFKKIHHVRFRYGFSSPDGKVANSAFTLHYTDTHNQIVANVV